MYGPTTEQSLEFSLTEEYCRNHFLVGLLLREVAEALQQGPDVRQLAVSALKNLLIKHAMDDRYTAFKVREEGETGTNFNHNTKCVRGIWMLFQLDFVDDELLHF